MFQKNLILKYVRKKSISGKVPEEHDTEKYLKEDINEKVQEKPNKDRDPDDEKGTEK